MTRSLTFEGEAPRASRRSRVRRSCSSVSVRCSRKIVAMRALPAMRGARRIWISACSSIEWASVRYLVSCSSRVMSRHVPRARPLELRSLPHADRDRLTRLLERELESFRDAHPRSAELHARARRSLLGGVPMPWMMLWAGGYPIVAERAEGNRLVDGDGHEYVDLCLGDTGAMTGHSPPEVVRVLQEALARGITTMLPSEDAAWVGVELGRRFGLPRWLFTLTATDANRTALRIARLLTGRQKVLVYSYCYHGSVDESFAVTAPDGSTRSRAGNVGPAVDPAETTRAVEFNDLAALEQALAHGDVACVLAEPAMTNMGIVLPDAGYHDALRAMTREHGTLLIIDETHTISAGP